MPTLRDHVRGALASADSTEVQAREDLRTVLLRRARAHGAARRARAMTLLPALAGAALVAYLAVRARAPSSPHDRGVHLYIRATSEPEDRALAIDLVAQGDH